MVRSFLAEVLHGVVQSRQRDASKDWHLDRVVLAHALDILVTAQLVNLYALDLPDHFLHAHGRADDDDEDGVHGDVDLKWDRITEIAEDRKAQQERVADELLGEE